MSDLPPKKEREENLKWIKWSTIFSWIAVLWTIFSWLMAYNALISSTRLSWVLEKNNEMETRIYQQRYDLYKEVGDAFVEFNVNSENKWTLDSAKELRKKLKKIWYWIRTIWTPYIICRYSNLLGSIDSYINFVEKESPAHAYTDYWRDVIPAVFLFEKSIRRTILGEEDPAPLFLIQWEATIWFYDFDSECWPWMENWISEEQYR